MKVGGVHHKELVVAALEVRTRPGGDKKKGESALYAGRLRLCHIANRNTETLTGFVKGNVEKGAKVRTDGWGGYDNLATGGYMMAHGITMLDQRGLV